jgi:16S rRNA C1402 (ribose-2'-O) methylase RsmI
VVVIEGAQVDEKWSEESVRDHLEQAMKNGAPFREAVAIITAQAGWQKRDVYDLALKLKADEKT